LVKQLRNAQAASLDRDSASTTSAPESQPIRYFSVRRRVACGRIPAATAAACLFTNK